ncbi:MAG: hypothetical protein HY453_00440 [Parcubacteria group bacterium]|nr:hypothetical protein [Parcubacteria group bacterium]
MTPEEAQNQALDDESMAEQIAANQRYVMQQKQLQSQQAAALAAEQTPSYGENFRKRSRNFLGTQGIAMVTSMGISSIVSFFYIIFHFLCAEVAHSSYFSKLGEEWVVKLYPTVRDEKDIKRLSWGFRYLDFLLLGITGMLMMIIIGFLVVNISLIVGVFQCMPEIYKVVPILGYILRVACSGVRFIYDAGVYGYELIKGE